MNDSGLQSGITSSVPRSQPYLDPDIYLECCQCVDNISSVTTDMPTHLTDLLKYFNLRCQLVLEAHALQVIGLRNYYKNKQTNKTVAFSLQCLQLIVYYIPMIQAHFKAQLPPKQWSILMHFGLIIKYYHDHIAEISAKLVVIMYSLLDKLLPKYEVKAPIPFPCFRNICKQMTKMHEAIFDLLHKEKHRCYF
jgi:vacuolar protein sorting-associated protein 54